MMNILDIASSYFPTHLAQLANALNISNPAGKMSEEFRFEKKKKSKARKCTKTGKIRKPKLKLVKKPVEMSNHTTYYETQFPFSEISNKSTSVLPKKKSQRLPSDVFVQKRKCKKMGLHNSVSNISSKTKDHNKHEQQVQSLVGSNFTVQNFEILRAAVTEFKKQRDNFLRSLSDLQQNLEELEVPNMFGGVQTSEDYSLKASDPKGQPAGEKNEEGKQLSTGSESESSESSDSSESSSASESEDSEPEQKGNKTNNPRESHEGEKNDTNEQGENIPQEVLRQYKNESLWKVKTDNSQGKPFVDFELALFKKNLSELRKKSTLGLSGEKAQVPAKGKRQEHIEHELAKLQKTMSQKQDLTHSVDRFSQREIMKKSLPECTIYN